MKPARCGESAETIVPTFVLGGVQPPAMRLAAEFTRYCPKCMSQQPFVADRFCLNGLVGKCASCQDECVVAYTRTTTEAA